MAEVPEVVVATQYDSCVVTVIQKSGPNSINPIALCEVMKKQHHFKFATIQQPAGLHISMTIPLAQEWPKILTALKASIKTMREKPELNHNSTVATYGLAANVPDQTFLNGLTKLHTAAMLDTI